MSLFFNPFRREPSMQSRQLSRLDEWSKDRASAVAAMNAAKITDTNFFHEEWAMVMHAECELKNRQYLDVLDAEIAELDRQDAAMKRIKDSARFTVLRMKRGLPFKSRRQPV